MYAAVVFNSLPIFDIVVFLSPLHLVDRPTQHFTFGYLFVELVVGSSVGMRNFLSEALASARSKLGPIFFSELATYVYVDDRNA